MYSIEMNKVLPDPYNTNSNNESTLSNVPSNRINQMNNYEEDDIALVDRVITFYKKENDEETIQFITDTIFELMPLYRNLILSYIDKDTKKEALEDIQYNEATLDYRFPTELRKLIKNVFDAKNYEESEKDLFTLRKTNIENIIKILHWAKVVSQEHVMNEYQISILKKERLFSFNEPKRSWLNFMKKKQPTVNRTHKGRRQRMKRNRTRKCNY